VKWHVGCIYPEYLYPSTSLNGVILLTAHLTFASSIPEIFRVPWLHKFPKIRNTASQTTFRSGRLEVGVARCQLAERVAEVIAMVSNTAVHRRLLKGLRKLFQFVDIPGFLMYSEHLTKQIDILRVLGSVKCSFNQKECMPDAMICNTDRIEPIFPNTLSMGLQTSIVYDLDINL